MSASLAHILILSLEYPMNLVLEKTKTKLTKYDLIEKLKSWASQIDPDSGSHIFMSPVVLVVEKERGH